MRAAHAAQLCRSQRFPQKSRTIDVALRATFAFQHHPSKLILRPVMLLGGASFVPATCRSEILGHAVWGAVVYTMSLRSFLVPAEWRCRRLVENTLGDFEPKFSGLSHKSRTFDVAPMATFAF
eukprot:CAMPEP_0171648142 /NCGR_PEP_ID=MMETSP0990-20121206/35925_1 /TAXON_ID=483369 /ORGANISM="non described non described, Strain CCMP2098" /LENGTH=122 /DNA_ID=CAMNT_0012225599 /DNA_START=211 /DNA_END=579 /DNA_ORIENTATION=+